MAGAKLGLPAALVVPKCCPFTGSPRVGLLPAAASRLGCMQALVSTHKEPAPLHTATVLRSVLPRSLHSVDPFTRKEWYDIKVPTLFDNRLVGKTPINRSAGTHIASEAMKGRVFEISLGDLNKDAHEHDYCKIKMVCEEVQGKNALCNFYGMSLTRDKLCSLIKKWQTLVEADVDVKTADGYVLRLFAIGFTKKQSNQLKKTAYAQSSQVRAIRKKMVDIMTAEVSKSKLKDVFAKLVAESISKDMEKAAESVFPLQNVYIRKVKILQRPKFDLTRLMELHGESGEDKGKALKKVEEGAVATMAGAGGRL